MAVSNSPFGDGFYWEGLVLSVAAPSWMRPGFAIPLVSLGQGSNALYIQDVDTEDLVTGLSPFDAPADLMSLVTNPVRTVVLAKPALHAVIDRDGTVVVGTREELSPIVTKWLPSIEWPVTRLAFADFTGDERQVMAAADAAIKDKAKRHGRTEASVWFVTSVVFNRLQRATLTTAATPERRAELEQALDQVRMEVTETEVFAHVPPVLMDLFDGANVLAKPGLALANKLAMLISPSGLTLAEKAKGPGPRGSRPQTSTWADPLPGGDFADLWIELQKDMSSAAWPIRWKSAWDRSRGHPDFESLGLGWLSSSGREAPELNGGLILTALLDERWRPLEADDPLQAAEDWLQKYSPVTPRWGKVWLRVAAFRRPMGDTIGMAFELLRMTREKMISHTDWTRVWTELKALEPDHLEELDHIAVQALPRFNGQPKFAKRIAIPLFNAEAPTTAFPEIWEWFTNPENLGNAWAEFYLHVVHARPDDKGLFDLGMSWLEQAPQGVKRWSRVWQEMFKTFGPRSELMAIGVDFVTRLKPEDRAFNIVAVTIELSNEAERRLARAIKATAPRV